MMGKVCQYATIQDKVCTSMKEVFIRGTQEALQKTIT
jgi:hypothetical protein